MTAARSSLRCCRSARRCFRSSRSAPWSWARSFAASIRAWRSSSRCRSSSSETSPYFFSKRSTRPAVSTIFCLPVKKGWHFEQISIRVAVCVERVWMISPHAQVMVASPYSGCMPVFTVRLLVGYSVSMLNRVRAYCRPCDGCISKEKPRPRGQLTLHTAVTGPYRPTCSCSRGSLYCSQPHASCRAKTPLTPPVPRG